MLSPGGSCFSVPSVLLGILSTAKMKSSLKKM